jgi:hypothetical protein
MLDVHAPHHRMQGFKDFLLHLFTITIGLLIALSLEGCVERHNHRMLVQEAEDGLRGEIAGNVKIVGSLRQQIKDQEKELDANLDVLSQVKTHPGEKHPLSFGFRMQPFDNVAWKTAQTTGAFAYMPYRDARTYSNIYATQDDLYKAEQEVVEDVLRAAAYPSTRSDDWQPTPAQVDALTENIGLLRMRLLLLRVFVDTLDGTYRDFEAQHR